MRKFIAAFVTLLALAACSAALASIQMDDGADEVPRHGVACVPVRSGLDGKPMSADAVRALRDLYRQYGIDADRYVGNYQVQNFAGRPYLRWMGDRDDAVVAVVVTPFHGPWHIWPHQLGGGTWWWDLTQMGASGEARIDLLDSMGRPTCYVLEVLR